MRIIRLDQDVIEPQEACDSHGSTSAETNVSFLFVFSSSTPQFKDFILFYSIHFGDDNKAIYCLFLEKCMDRIVMNDTQEYISIQGNAFTFEKSNETMKIGVESVSLYKGEALSCLQQCSVAVHIEDSIKYCSSVVFMLQSSIYPSGGFP